MIISKNLLKEFWKLKKVSLKGFEEEYSAYKTAEGWFQKNEKALFKFLKRRQFRVEAIINKTEIQKLVRKHFPYIRIRRWEEDQLIVEVDIFKLKRKVVRGIELFSLPEDIRIRKGSYTLCPVLKEKETKLYLLTR